MSTTHILTASLKLSQLVKLIHQSFILTGWLHQDKTNKQRNQNKMRQMRDKSELGQY